MDDCSPTMNVTYISNGCLLRWHNGYTFCCSVNVVCCKSKLQLQVLACILEIHNLSAHHWPFWVMVIMGLNKTQHWSLCEVMCKWLSTPPWCQQASPDPLIKGIFHHQKLGTWVSDTMNIWLSSGLQVLQCRSFYSAPLNSIKTCSDLCPWYFLFSAPVYMLHCGAFGNLYTKDFNWTIKNCFPMHGFRRANWKSAWM